ncbi:hypothetical protein ACH4GK_32155 [Streptomyces rimosus]|uniref:hypothetical protein n=1 Tax=Streptomyces rimosus TaxID=1927 RepID=UPI00067B7AD4|nr:hypothetical protein [Streptomyces rimosus]
MNANPIPVPVPDAVTAFKARRLPQYVTDAVRLQADAVDALYLCTGPRFEEARQHQQAQIARANKVLATVPARGSLVVRGAA